MDGRSSINISCIATMQIYQIYEMEFYSTNSFSLYFSLPTFSLYNKLSLSAIFLSILACFSADFLLDSSIDYCSACISSYINRKSQKHQKNTKSGTLVPDKLVSELQFRSITAFAVLSNSFRVERAIGGRNRSHKSREVSRTIQVLCSVAVFTDLVNYCY